MKKMRFSGQYVSEAVQAIHEFAVCKVGHIVYELTEEQRVEIREACEAFLASKHSFPTPPVTDIMSEHETHCGVKHRTKDAYIDCNQRHAQRMDLDYRRANPE